MLEAGRSFEKHGRDFKNVSLVAVACIMYMVVGYSIMYNGDIFLSTITGSGVVEVVRRLLSHPLLHRLLPGRLRSHRYVDVSGAVAERMKLFAFLTFAVVMTGFIYPMEGSWTWGGNPVLACTPWVTLASSISQEVAVYMAGAATALAGVMLVGARRASTAQMAKSTPSPAPTAPLSVPLSVVGLVRI